MGCGPLAGTKSGSLGVWSWVEKVVAGEESEPPPKKEKKESKKLTAWWACSCSTAPISRFFLGAALASESSRERRIASNFIAVSGRLS